MSKARGTPNRATAERRQVLLARMRERLRDRSAGPPSWRDLAAAAGVSLSTLNHHFGRRDDVIRALLEDERAQGAEQLAIMSRPTGTFAQSVHDAIAHLAGAMVRADFDRMIAAGLAEGLGHPSTGPAFVNNLLEPLLAAVEDRLTQHVMAGEMREGATRVAAIELAAPVIVAVLHQRPLGGEGIRLLSLDQFLNLHADAFVRGWQA